MMQKQVLLYDEPAVKIPAVRLKPLEKATLYDCEGDKIWIPNSVSKYNERDEAVVIKEWWYNKAVQDGKL